MPHPDTLPEPDETADAIFERIIRDEHGWTIVTNAQRAHAEWETAREIARRLNVRLAGD